MKRKITSSINEELHIEASTYALKYFKKQHQLSNLIELALKEYMKNHPLNGKPQTQSSKWEIKK